MAWGREQVDLTASVAEAAAAVRPGAPGAIDDVVGVLLLVDAAKDDDLARRALRVLSSRPRVMVRLDERVRRSSWAASALDEAIEKAARSVGPIGKAAASAGPIGKAAGSAGLVLKAARGVGRGAGPVAMAFASMHRDGHLREHAVAGMLAGPDPVWLPFLVLRSTDWVGPVRERARGGLAMLLGGAPEACLPAVLPAALTVREWHRGRFAYAQTLAALLLAEAPLRDELLDSSAGDAGRRRFLLDLGLTHGWWSAESVLALSGPGDVRVRTRSAEVVCREAVWSNRVDTLHRLAGHGAPEVRSQALVGLARLGRHTDVTAALNDPASLLRAIARASARTSGIDVAVHYREAAGRPDPEVGAIAGLAEVGTPADADILVPLLSHARSPVRAHAVRALHALDAVPVDRAVELLRDPSPAVIREATNALRRRPRSVPADVARQLLADPDRVEVRRAGYRLLQDHGPIERLRAALLLATDADPSLARRAVADATRFARDAASLSWRRVPVPIGEATPEQAADLTRRTTLAAAALGPETTALLNGWLSGGS